MLRLPCFQVLFSPPGAIGLQMQICGICNLIAFRIISQIWELSRLSYWACSCFFYMLTNAEIPGDFRLQGFLISTQAVWACIRKSAPASRNKQGVGTMPNGCLSSRFRPRQTHQWYHRTGSWTRADRYSRLIYGYFSFICISLLHILPGI